MRNPRPRILSALLVAPLLLLAAAGASCGKKDDGSGGTGGGKSRRDRTVNIVALFDTLRTSHRGSQLFLLQRLTSLRAGTTLKIMDAIGDPAMQLEQFAKAQAGKYDFILVFPIDPVAAQPALERAKQDGAKVIVFSDGVAASARSTAIVCPEREVGKGAAEFVIRSLKQKAAEHQVVGPPAPGRVVQLSADVPGESVLSERAAGFAATINGGSGAILAHDAPCGPNGEETAARIAEALRLQKHFDVIFAHTDFIAQSAARALAAAQPELREQVLVLGVGGSLDMVINSEIDATIYNPPLVDLAWVLILRYLEGPDFVPKPRYDRVPLAINLESALELSRNGFPMPKLDE